MGNHRKNSVLQCIDGMVADELTTRMSGNV